MLLYVCLDGQVWVYVSHQYHACSQFIHNLYIHHDSFSVAMEFLLQSWPATYVHSLLV